MYKILLLSTLIILVDFVHAQIKAPLVIEEYKRGLNPVDEIPLFDLNEIKLRKIDTAYIIYHPASWAEYDKIINPCSCSYNDTLALYRFDHQGHIIQYTYFQRLGDYSTTFHYDTLGNITSRDMFRRYGAYKGTTSYPYNNSDTSSSNKLIIKRRKEGNDSIITTIVFIKFSKGLDTAIIETKRYNSKGQLLEDQSSVNKRNALEFDDDTGENTYHYIYDYDDKGRLIYYRDFETKEYKRISYPFYGKLTEIFDVGTNELKARHTKMVNNENGIISITFENRQLVLTPLEKGSKLFKLQTFIDVGEVPLIQYHEIVYK